MFTSHSRRLYRAVIFDIGGVLVPQPQIGIRKYEKELSLPPGFLGAVFTHNEPDNSFSKLERGELLLSEFLNEFDLEARNAAKRENVDLKNFSTSTLFQKMKVPVAEEGAHHEMFHAIKVLKRNGIKTCALTNDWIDDTVENVFKGGCVTALPRFFDVVVRSSLEGIRKPDPNIYNLACFRLGVNPKETIFLDDIGRNLKTAAGIGITCIKVNSPRKAVQKLQDLVGFELFPEKPRTVVYPPPCKPHHVPHSVATLKSGIKIHYVDIGEGPAVMLFHGFPDSWYSWRHQIPALASAGYRVIAMDQRGYGNSSVPYAIEEYTQKKLCEDAIGLMDCIGIHRPAIIGHDWGGQVVWNLALHYPHRIQAVASISTPFFTGEGVKRLLSQIEVFDYQEYFQAPGVAEKEFENDMARVFKIILRGYNDDPLPSPDGKIITLDTTNVRKRGGMLVGFPQEVPNGKMLSEDDLAYYVEQYRKSGFRGPLNWYRTRKANTEWNQSLAKRKINAPALMISPSHDSVLKPEFSIGMEERIPYLSRVSLQHCGHFAQAEKPDEVNDALITWLNRLFKRTSKL